MSKFCGNCNCELDSKWRYPKVGNSQIDICFDCHSIFMESCFCYECGKNLIFANKNFELINNNKKLICLDCISIDKANNLYYINNMLIDKNIIDHCIKYGQNCLMEAHAGVGKSSIILEAFKKNNLRYLYLSGPTTDPFLDLIGLPHKVGDKKFEYLLPDNLADTEIEAIFIDEFNRAKPRVISALMELLQFKQINGRKFPKLKCIFAAINPFSEEDETYTVEYLDPAILDRFQIKIELPYKVDYDYFKDKFGEKYADAACNWWNALNPEQKKHVSPRRLDYALEIYQNNGNLRWVLPDKTVNVSDLTAQLESGSFVKTMNTIFKNRDNKAAKEKMQEENFYFNVKDEILKDKNKIEFFLPLIDKESMTALVQQNVLFHKYAIENIENFHNIFGVPLKLDYDALPIAIKKPLIMFWNSQKNNDVSNNETPAPTTSGGTSNNNKNKKKKASPFKVKEPTKWVENSAPAFSQE